MFMSILKFFNLRNPFVNDIDSYIYCMNHAEKYENHNESWYDGDLYNEWLDLAAEYVGFKDHEHYEQYLRRHGEIRLNRTNPIIRSKGV